MVAWVVINRQHLPRAARGPSQPRKSRPIRALPLAARLFNNPTFKPANDPQFPPASIPILELTPPSSHRKSPPSFHALTWNPFCNPFVFIFMHVMGGYTLLGASTAYPLLPIPYPLSFQIRAHSLQKTPGGVGHCYSRALRGEGGAILNSSSCPQCTRSFSGNPSFVFFTTDHCSLITDHFLQGTVLLRLRPLRVLFVEAQMPVVHGGQLPPDEEVLDVGGQFKRVAVGHNEVGELALLEGSNLIVEAKNPRRINRDGLERFLIRQAVSDGVRGVLSQPPREGIIEAGEGKFHAGSGKLRGLGKQTVIRIVLVERKREHRAKDYGNTFRAEQVLNLVSLRAAGENHPQPLLVAKLDRGANLSRAIGKDQERQLAANDRHQRFELQVAIVLGSRTLFHCLGIVPRALQPVGDFIHLFVVFLLGLAVRFFFSGESSEVERAGFDLWPIQHHRSAFLDEHFVDGPASEVNGGSLPTDHTCRAAGIKTAAAGNGKNFRDARRAGDGSVFARGRHRGGRDNVRVVTSCLGRIDGGADGADLPQTHLGNRVEQSRVNLQSFRVDHLGSSGDVQADADRRDFSIADDERAVFDGAPCESEDFRVSQSVGSWRLSLSNSIRRAEEVNEVNEVKEIKETTASSCVAHSAPPVRRAAMSGAIVAPTAFGVARGGLGFSSGFFSSGFFSSGFFSAGFCTMGAAASGFLSSGFFSSDFLNLSMSAFFSFSRSGRAAMSRWRSKYTRPSMRVFCTTAYALSGSRL